MPVAPDSKPLLERGELVDPTSFEPLVPSEDGEWLVARSSGRRYPIHDGVPALRPQDALPLPQPAG